MKAEINQKIIVWLKILTIISFLAITHPGGTLTLANILWIIIGTIASFIELLCIDCGNYFESFLKLLLNCIVMSSFYLIFRKKKLLAIGSIIVQLIYLEYTYNIEYLNYIYYTIPILIYLSLSVILAYYIFFKTEKNNL